MRLILLAVLAAAPALAADAPKARLALLPPRVEGGVKAGLGESLNDLVAADVVKAQKYQVITSADVAMVLGYERGKELLGCSEGSSCFAEIGSALGVDVLCDLSLGAVGNLRVLAVRLIDAKTATPLRRESATVKSEEELVDAIHLLVAKVFDLPLPKKKVPPNPGLFVLGGAGALALGGLSLGLLANNDYQRFKADPFNDPLGDRAKLEAGVADGLYAGAIVAAAVGTVLFFVNRQPEEPAGAGGF